ncbi:hypothetical protein ACE1CI_17960 [Aerosakkonemataceae cyanobacterium BLCC-F50]|uniref:DUF6888 domain-containing protein n=1 Tax=Floridaenema flaviceps BLCC-F50 TaxID=3153642 RepID=A0ABV4XV46_9CYAN
MIPTVEQMLVSVRVCQTLSNFYTDIHLFRYDEKRQEIYILAGDTIGIIIKGNGDWEFDDDTEA